MKIDPKKLTQYQEFFLTQFPDDKGFESTSYRKYERGYKDELLSLYRQNVERDLSESLVAKNAVDLANAIIDLFFHKLQSTGEVQNLVGWRYTEFLRLLDSNAKVELVGAVRELINDDLDLDARIVKFYEVVDRLSHGVNKRTSPAQKRSLATFFLWINEPSKYLFVKTNEMRQAAKELTGVNPVGADRELATFFEFGRLVETALRNEGWSPKDMTDVQSFLWISRKYGGDFGAEQAEAMLEERYGYRARRTKYIAAFEIAPGLQLALVRDKKSVRLFLPRAPSAIVGVNIRRVYEAGEPRNSNLTSQAPLLAADKPATLVEVESADALETLCDWLEGGSPGSTLSKIGDAEMEYRAAGQPLNQILYGPPGTGKTFRTVDRALAILDPDFLEENGHSRPELKERVDELQRRGRIGFVTFHQSFSYEDFVEGLRASCTDDGKVFYEIEDGIFKRLCDTAAARTLMSSGEGIDWQGKTIWKMSLGNTLGDDAEIFDECIADGKVLLGYGADIDFSDAPDREAVARHFRKAGEEVQESDYPTTAVNLFKNTMAVGDLVVVSDGNQKFRAIGEITGDYKFVPEAARPSYRQMRNVLWHRVYAPSLPYDSLMNKVFSQMTLYKLRPPSIDLDKLQGLLGQSEEGGTGHDNAPCVLVIDEINRGNIANILGELITLIEPNKRAGAKEALTVTLPYSKRSFSVPDNLYLIGTMNTADRSIAHIDTALRRRFHFEAMLPDTSVLRELGIEIVDGVDVTKMLDAINKRITLLYDQDHTIGHSFFVPLRDDPTVRRIAVIFESSILPLLEEYFFEDWSKIRQILGDQFKGDPALQFYVPSYRDSDISDLLGNEAQDALAEKIFQRNPHALSSAQAYVQIYRPETQGGS